MAEKPAAVKAAYIGLVGLVLAALVTGGFGLFSKDASAGKDPKEDSDTATAEERVRYNEELLKTILAQIDEDRKTGDKNSEWSSLKADFRIAFANRNSALKDNAGLALKLATRARIRELLRRADRLKGSDTYSQAVNASASKEPKEVEASASKEPRRIYVAHEPK